MANSTIVLTFITSLLIIFNCSNEGPDLGTYYQKNYVDYIDTVMQIDSVHIIIEQFGVVDRVLENIPYLIENDTSLSDTIKLILDVKFGSYSPNPNPTKDLQISNDTLYLWYASREKPALIYLKKSNSNNNISGIQTSPRLEYYSIEKATIKKSQNKKISFESRIYR